MVVRHPAVTLLALLVAGLAVAACSRPAPAPPLPRIAQVPAFTLNDQTGAAFDSRTLSGKVWVANFIFTRCPDICPTFTAKMAQVQRDTQPSIALLSFSVDPTYDTPERLAAYAKQHGADPARWRFLTGDQAAMQTTVEQGLKTAMVREGEKGGVPQIGHGSHFVLVDQTGQIRGVYDMNDADAVARVVRDAGRLATP